MVERIYGGTSIDRTAERWSRHNTWWHVWKDHK